MPAKKASADDADMLDEQKKNTKSPAAKTNKVSSSDEDSGDDSSKNSGKDSLPVSPITNPAKYDQMLADMHALQKKADVEDSPFLKALQDFFAKKYTEEAQKNIKLEADIDALRQQMENLESKLQDKTTKKSKVVKKDVVKKDDNGTDGSDTDDGTSSTDGDAAKKAKKKKANKLAAIRNKLKDGVLTKDMYLYLKNECDTKTTQNNVIIAFKAYKEMRGKDCDDNITFNDMLKDMESILA
jgi:hypothetical protein